MVKYNLDAKAFEALEASQKALYEKTESGYRLNLELDEGFEVADTSKLLNALQSERNAAKTLKRKVAELEKSSTADPDEDDARKKSFKAQYEQQLADSKKKIEELQGSLRKQKMDVAIRDALPAGTRTKLLLPHLQSRLGFDDAGSLVVLDDAGNPRISRKSVGNMTVQELIEELKTDPEFGACFPASDKTGSGGARSASNPNGMDMSKLTPSQKLEAALK